MKRCSRTSFAQLFTQLFAWVFAWLFAGWGFAIGPATAEPAPECVDAEPINHTYPSGAKWSMCAALNEGFGLHLTELHYQPPGKPARRTFSELHLAGLLEHHHNEPEERSVLSELNFGGDAFVNFDTQTCPGELETINGSLNTVCTVEYADRILAKFGAKSVLQSHSWDVITAASDGQDVWEVLVSFGEEGTVTPTINRSGVVHRFTDNASFGSPGINNSAGSGRFAVNSTLLATWRMVPGFASADDGLRVEQFDFPLRTDLGNRRPMSVSELGTETLRQVDREKFRTWLVTDLDGAGYSLDVQNNGFQFRSRRFNWALFDVAFTRFNRCEQLTLDNPPGNNECGTSLEAFINGESLENTIPVIWFSQSMPIIPGAEDKPLMQTRTLSFDLVPFDWTDVSPFAPTLSGDDGS